MMLQCSFFVDVAMMLFKDSSAGRSRAGLSGETGYCEGNSKDQTQLNYTESAQK
jgi:hypothetical protein